MYYGAYKSGFLSVLHSIDMLKKSKTMQFSDEVSEESKVTAETDLLGSSADGGRYFSHFFILLFTHFRVTRRNLQ